MCWMDILWITEMKLCPLYQLFNFNDWSVGQLVSDAPPAALTRVTREHKHSAGFSKITNEAS